MSKENQTVQISPGQVKDLGSALLQSIPMRLTKQQTQYWLGHKGELSAGIKKLLLANSDSDVGFDVAIEDWQVFYKKFFDLDVDLSGLVVPPKQPGFGRLLVNVQGVTIQQALDVCQNLFPCWKYTDENLEEVVIHDDRTAKDDYYAIWVRDRQEADEELKSKSANDLSKAKIPTETLLERIIHELKYFQETGKHLDVGDITLCAGSRDRDGGVPLVSWSGGKFRVRWYHPGSAREIWRARQVVSS